MAKSSDIVWGIDLNVEQINIGSVRLDGSRPLIHIVRWGKMKPGSDRLSAAYKCMLEQVAKVAVEQPPIFVAIEQPSGRRASLTLVYMAGVVQAAVHDALVAHWKQPIQDRMIPPKSWKFDVLGTGSANKPKKDDDWEYLAITEARKLGYTVVSDHDGDAGCIAEYARRQIRFG